MKPGAKDAEISPILCPLSSNIGDEKIREANIEFSKCQTEDYNQHHETQSGDSIGSPMSQVMS